MQARIYEFFKTHKNKFQILIVNDDKDAFKAHAAATYAGRECFVLPDFRAISALFFCLKNTLLGYVSKPLSLASSF